MNALVRDRFSLAPGEIYLDSATYGLPPDATTATLQRALGAWATGSAHWIEDLDRPCDDARRSFARIVGCEAEEVAMLPSASSGAGLVAASLGPSDEVIVSDDEFTSILFPLLLARDRGATVLTVPFRMLSSAVRPTTTLVAFSLVQMQSGRVADVEAVLSSARQAGAATLVDGTQGIPFVGLSPYLDRIDYLVCSAYKHLLSPRGTAFLRIRRERWDEVQPLMANWRAAVSPYSRFFGEPLDLAPDARRFDVSLAWLPWLGTVESLRLIVDWQDSGVLDNAILLAQRLAGGLEVAWSGSTLVCLDVRDPDEARHRLTGARIKASIRGARLRLSVHVYNTHDEVDRVADVVSPLIDRTSGALGSASTVAP